MILDVREQHEVAKHRLDYQNILYIPKDMIQFNQQTIRDMKERIYILCRTGRRAKLVKDTYFKDDENINIIDGGIEQMKKDKFKIISIGDVYTPLKKTQIISGIIIMIGLLLGYWGCLF